MMPNSTSDPGSSPETPLFTPDDLREFRQALTLDLGRDEAWSDDELQMMATNALHFIAVLRRIAATLQRHRS